jgi:hypothetical protein
LPPVSFARLTIAWPEGWDAPMTDEQPERFLEGKEW